jgi:hypothetical protein
MRLGMEQLLMPELGFGSGIKDRNRHQGEG